MYAQTECGVCVCVLEQVSELYRTGKPIKRIDTASTDKQENRFVKLLSEKMAGKGSSGNPSVTDRCRFVVEKFLSLDLDDTGLDLQRFMKEELLPSGGKLLNRS